MTLISSIITDAFRESNMLPIGKVPTANQSAEALARLQNLVFSFPGDDAGYLLSDWNVSSAAIIRRPSGILEIPAGFEIYPQSRLVCSLTVATNLSLERQPQDGQRFAVVGDFFTFNLTITGNGRLIEGAATKVLSTNAVALQWFYRADTRNWTPIAALALDAAFPFPEEFDDYFIIMLAMRLNPRYGRTLDDQSQARLIDQKSAIALRYSQSRIREPVQPQAPQTATNGGNK